MQPQQENTRRSKRLTRNQLVAIGVLGIALLIAIALVVAAMVAQSSPAAEVPSGSADKHTVEETEAPSAPEDPPTVESIEIDGALISDPEALAQRFVADAGTEWINAGGTLQNANEAYDAAASVEEHMFEVASKYDAPYIEALFIADWESNPRIVDYLESLKRIHRVTVALYAKTIHPELIPEDIEPYRRTTILKSVDSVTTNADGSFSMILTSYDLDNSDKNRVGEDLIEEVVNQDLLATSSYTFVVENGKVKLADIIRGEYYTR